MKARFKTWLIRVITTGLEEGETLPLTIRDALLWQVAALPGFDASIDEGRVKLFAYDAVDADGDQ